MLFLKVAYSKQDGHVSQAVLRGSRLEPSSGIHFETFQGALLAALWQGPGRI